MTTLPMADLAAPTPASPLTAVVPPFNEGDPIAHVREMLAEFENVMLVTFDGHGPSGAPRAHARPMRIARLDDDCTLWFVTDVDSPKIDEALSPPLEGHVTAQSKTRFLALRGGFRVSRDPQRLREVWTKADDVWFPDGPTSPKACLLAFVPAEAELWDMSGARGLKFLLNAAKALLTGEPPKPVPEAHDVVALRRG